MDEGNADTVTEEDFYDVVLDELCKAARHGNHNAAGAIIYGLLHWHCHYASDQDFRPLEVLYNDEYKDIVFRYPPTLEFVITRYSDETARTSDRSRDKVAIELWKSFVPLINWGSRPSAEELDKDERLRQLDELAGHIEKLLQNLRRLEQFYEQISTREQSTEQSDRILEEPSAEKLKELVEVQDIFKALQNMAERARYAFDGSTNPERYPLIKEKVLNKLQTNLQALTHVWQVLKSLGKPARALECYEGNVRKAKRRGDNFEDGEDTDPLGAIELWPYPERWVIQRLLRLRFCSSLGTHLAG